MADMKTASSPSSDYSVKNIEPVLKGTDVQAGIFTLAPGESIPWDNHDKSTDHYFVLERKLTINQRHEGEQTDSLGVGGRYKIGPGTPHLISNQSDTDCRFLLYKA